MKKFTLFIVSIVFIMLTLASCIVIPMQSSYDIDAKTVSSIEIYDLCEVDTLYGDFVKTKEPVYEIPQEDISNFLSDLGEITFTDQIIISIAATDPSFYYDHWTARINFSDSSYELVSCDGYGATYDKNDKITKEHHFGCDDEVWYVLIQKYLPDEIFNHPH